MTEQEWLACADPGPMLQFIRQVATDRQLRMFVFACCRSVWGTATDDATRYALSVAQQIADTARALDLLYLAYSNRFGNVTGWQADHPKLQIKLYKDRNEMRRVNPGLGWAEAAMKRGLVVSSPIISMPKVWAAETI